MSYPEVIDEAPMHINEQTIHKVCARYGDDADALETVALAIATYANPRGKAFPGVSLLARLTGYAVNEVSRLTHILQAAGVFTICLVKSKGAPHAHNVYYFAKNFIHRTANVTSAHFIGNLKNWKAKAEDVAAAVKTTAKKAIDNLVEQAAKLAAVFQEQPELLESPEQAAHVAGIVGTATIPSVSDAMPELVQEGAEPVGEWPDAARPVKWGNAPMISESMPTTTAPTVPLADSLTSYRAADAPRVYSSWRDRVAAYREGTVKN